MTEKNCGNCRFWNMHENDPNEGEPKGNCMRFPPVYTGPPVAMGQSILVVDMHPLDNANWNHPPTFESLWCGEWQSLPIHEPVKAGGRTE